jgi:hypothetical protein
MGNIAAYATGSADKLAVQRHAQSHAPTVAVVRALHSLGRMQLQLAVRGMRIHAPCMCQACIHTHTQLIHTHTHSYTLIHTHTHSYTPYTIHTHTHSCILMHTHAHSFTHCELHIPFTPLTPPLSPPDLHRSAR